MTFTNKEYVKALKLALDCLKHAKELKEQSPEAYNRRYFAFGLCSIIDCRYPDDTHYLKQRAIKKIIREDAIKRTKFYDMDGSEVHFKHLFIFHPQNYTYRRNWLLRKIKEYENK